MCLKPICGVTSFFESFFMRGKMALGNREICGLDTWRRWFCKIRNGYRHGTALIQTETPLGGAIKKARSEEFD